VSTSAAADGAAEDRPCEKHEAGDHDQRDFERIVRSVPAPAERTWCWPAPALAAPRRSSSTACASHEHSLEIQATGNNRLAIKWVCGQETTPLASATHLQSPQNQAPWLHRAEVGLEFRTSSGWALQYLARWESPELRWGSGSRSFTWGSIEISKTFR
jgi:hypothetical protein